MLQKPIVLMKKKAPKWYHAYLVMEFMISVVFGDRNFKTNHKYIYPMNGLIYKALN